MRRALAIVLMLVAAPPAYAQEPHATVRADPWHLTVTDGARVILDGGALSYSTAAGSFHATRVLSERRDGRDYSAELATDDPLGGRIRLRLAPAAEGVLS